MLMIFLVDGNHKMEQFSSKKKRINLSKKFYLWEPDYATTILKS